MSTTVEMTPFEFLKYASGQIEKVFDDDGKKAGDRLDALKSSIESVPETSFSQESPSPIKVETFGEAAAAVESDTLSHDAGAEDVAKIDALGKDFEELKAADGADEGFPDDLNAEQFDENGVRKADGGSEWGSDPSDE